MITCFTIINTSSLKNSVLFEFLSHFERVPYGILKRDFEKEHNVKIIVRYTESDYVRLYVEDA